MERSNELSEFIHRAPGKMMYLKLDLGTPGRVIWVPLCGPLNPANLSIGSGHFRQVSEILKTLISDNLFC